MKAIDIALKGHHNQKYGEFKYFHHLTCVVREATLAWEGQLPQEIEDLCWLHDLKEDQYCYYLEIEHLLSEELVVGIDAITKRATESRREYLERCCGNKDAHFVKICDTLSNLNHSVRDFNSSRVSRYTKQLDFLMKKRSKLYGNMG